ncbi:unnamed protein product, partial [marine sediment metagenome]
ILDRMAEDTGCSEHDDCLTCPFPKCIYDDNYGVVRARNAKRQLVIRQMLQHDSVKGVARQLGVSERTVQRAVKEQ